MASTTRATCPDEGCGKTFYNKYNLKRHFDAKHLNIQPFVCSLCGNVLSSKQTLNEHMNAHTGNEPYACSFPGCAKRFKQASTLSVHKKTHQRRQTVDETEDIDLLPYWIPHGSSHEQVQKLLTLPKIRGPQEARLPNIFRSN